MSINLKNLELKRVKVFITKINYRIVEVPFRTYKNRKYLDVSPTPETLFVLNQFTKWTVLD